MMMKLLYPIRILKYAHMIPRTNVFSILMDLRRRKTEFAIQ